MKGKFLTLIGTALTLALSSTVAVAQSSKFPDTDFQNNEETTQTSDSGESLVAAAQEKLSPEGMEILCQRFPLNSRCEGTDTTTSPEDTTEEITPSQENISPDINIDTTPQAPLPESSPEEMQPAPGNTLPEFSPEEMQPTPGNTVPEFSPEEIQPAPGNTLPEFSPNGVTPLPDSAPETESTQGSENETPSNINPVPELTPETESIEESENETPSNINPAPELTPEAESSEGSENDAPSNINPMPGTVPNLDTPSNINQPAGEITLPNSDSPSNTEEVNPNQGGAKILAPQ